MLIEILASRTSRRNRSASRALLRRILGLSCLLALLSVTSCKTSHQEFFPDGSIRRQGNINAVTRNMVGPWITFYASGSKRSEGAYDGDLQSGHWRFYRDGAGVEMEGSFDSEARVGTWTFYHPNKQKSAEGVYRSDDQDGSWTYWDADGHRTQEGQFRRGRLTLQWTYWNPGAGPKARGYLFEGGRVGRWEFWDEAGTLAVKEYPLPAEVELVREAWDDGATCRKEGFLVEGKRMGRWVTFHRNGNRRYSGDFYENKAVGHWSAYDAEGEPFGTGVVSGDRVMPGWKFSIKSSVGDRPAQPATGDWSSVDLLDHESPNAVVTRWHREMLAPTEPGGFGTPPEPTGDAPTEAEIARAAPAPEEVVVDSDLSVKERAALEQLVGAYEGRGLSEGSSGAGAGGAYTAAASGRKPVGDTALSKALIGRELPVTVFKTATGDELDLAEFRGEHNLIVVILRGFAGRICVYCAAQTRAYKNVDVLKQIQEHDGKVIVVYPGPKGALRSFLRAYRAEFDQTDPPFPLVYDPDLQLTSALGITGARAKPSTLIVDKSGRIQYAYVAKKKKDRLGADWLVEALEQVDSTKGSTP